MPAVLTGANSNEIQLTSLDLCTFKRISLMGNIMHRDTFILFPDIQTITDLFRIFK